MGGKSIKKIVPDIVCGLVTGLANGVFGAGGGMVAVLMMTRVLHMEQDKAHAQAIAVILPLSAISGAVYIAGGDMDWHVLLWVAPALCIGSFAGAKLTGKLGGVWLRRIFALAMTASAVFMLI